MANTYQFTVTSVCAGQFFQNVMHYKLSESGASNPAAWAAALITAWETSVRAKWLDCQTSTAEMRSLKAKRVTGGGGPTAITLYGAAVHNGTRGTTCSTTAEAAIMEFPVNLNGKNVTGKIFLAGIDDADILNNTFDAPFLTPFNALKTQILTALTLAGGLGTATFTIFNKATQTDTIPTFGAIGLTVGTQKRRLHPGA